MKKVGEVVEVLEDGTYKVEYADDGGITQTETCGADKLGPVEGETKPEEEEEKEESGDA